MLPSQMHSASTSHKQRNNINHLSRTSGDLVVWKSDVSWTWNMMNCINRSNISGFPNQNRSSLGFIWVPIAAGPVCSRTSSAKEETTCWSFVPTSMTSFVPKQSNKLSVLEQFICLVKKLEHRYLQPPVWKKAKSRYLNLLNRDNFKQPEKEKEKKREEEIRHIWSYNSILSSKVTVNVDKDAKNGVAP